MTVQQDLANLEKLQELDLKNADIRKELETIPQNIEDDSVNVETIRVILQKEKQRLDEAEVWRRDKESEIELQNDLLIKSKSKLQVAQKERESKAAQREIDTIKKNIQDQEKELIELMEAIEQYRVAIDEHTGEFAELEEQLKKTEADGAARIEEINSKIDETASHRKELTSHISERVLRLYERLYKRLGNVLVKISEPSCTACNFGMLPQAYNELQVGNKIISCTSCLRILVFDGTATMNVAEPAEAEE